MQKYIEIDVTGFLIQMTYWIIAISTNYYLYYYIKIIPENASFIKSLLLHNNKISVSIVEKLYKILVYFYKIKVLKDILNTIY